jgi:chromosome segregation ATPase
MDDSTTAKRTRVQQCHLNAHARSQQKRRAAFEAIAALQQEQRTITKAAVARRAGVSLVFLRSHADLVQAIEEAQRMRSASPPAEVALEQAKDQIIAALRRRLDDLKQQLANKDAQLRERQRIIDQLYGKLAAASPLTDAELRRALADALARLAQQEPHPAETN